MTRATTGAIGASLDRVEGREKVTGAAKYAYEHDLGEVAYAAIVQATIAKGEIRSVDPAAALAVPGVLAVLWYGNAPRLQRVDDGELALFQSNRVAYRGQIIAAVVADSLETARHAERLVGVEYAPAPHDTLLRVDHPALYKPDKVNPYYETDTEQGDFDAAPRRRSPSTRPTRHPPTTTTRWSRTPPPRSGRATA